MTKFYLILFLLLSCGVAEAQQDLYSDCLHKGADDKTYDICRLHELRWYTDPATGLNVVSKCELKMKEAMKLADGTLFNRPAYRTPSSFEEREQRYRDDKAAWEKWNAVMKECVK